MKTNLNSSHGPEDRVQITLQGKGAGWSETWEKVIEGKKNVSFHKTQVQKKVWW